MSNTPINEQISRLIAETKKELVSRHEFAFAIADQVIDAYWEITEHPKFATTLHRDYDIFRSSYSSPPYRLDSFPTKIQEIIENDLQIRYTDRGRIGEKTKEYLEQQCNKIYDLKTKAKEIVNMQHTPQHASNNPSNFTYPLTIKNHDFTQQTYSTLNEIIKTLEQVHLRFLDIKEQMEAIYIDFTQDYRYVVIKKELIRQAEQQRRFISDSGDGEILRDIWIRETIETKYLSKETIYMGLKIVVHHYENILPARYIPLYTTAPQQRTVIQTKFATFVAEEMYTTIESQVRKVDIEGLIQRHEQLKQMHMPSGRFDKNRWRLAIDHDLEFLFAPIKLLPLFTTNFSDLTHWGFHPSQLQAIRAEGQLDRVDAINKNITRGIQVAYNILGIDYQNLPRQHSIYDYLTKSQNEINTRETLKWAKERLQEIIWRKD